MGKEKEDSKSRREGTGAGSWPPRKVGRARLGPAGPGGWGRLQPKREVGAGSGPQPPGRGPGAGSAPRGQGRPGAGSGRGGPPRSLPRGGLGAALPLAHTVRAPPAA